MVSVEVEVNRTTRILYEPGSMPFFVMEQLTAGIMSAFLPVSFIREEENYEGIYKIESYVPFETVKEIPLKVMMEIFCRLLQLLSDNEKHYFSGAEYQINLQTVYTDLMNHQVKLIYMPLRVPRTMKQQLKDFLMSCKSKVSETGWGYLDDMADFLMREEVGYYSTIRHGEQLQYEIAVCDIR